MDLKKVLDDWMQQMKSELIVTYNEKRLKASGNFERSLRVETSDMRSKMFAPAYTYNLIYGRNPTAKGKRMPVSVIQKWINDKGLDLNAWAVARSIDKKGIKVPNAFNDGKLLKDTFTEDSFDKLYKSISIGYLTEIKSLWQLQ